ncbi:MAG: hypothetical protein K1X88_32885 [Nannocystaceae bacterium]|nr:hypothetical protein [Nannocystaceae bacterium]
MIRLALASSAATLALACAPPPAPAGAPVAARRTDTPAVRDDAAARTGDDAGARIEPSPPPSEPGSVPTSAPEPAPAPKPVGCWERTFGQPPAAGSETPSLKAAVPGCDRCETLVLGPRAEGLHPQVLVRVRDVVEALPRPEVDEPVLWINSGRRDGEPDDSMHNQALAIDAVICGMDTRQTGARLREAGFTCVIEYYDAAGNPCHFAHADLRGTQWAQGAYAKGGRKEKTCPKRAKSKTMKCDGSTKRDWTYSEG